MEAREFITISNDTVNIHKTKGKYSIDFLCALIHPFVESYLTAVMYLLQLSEKPRVISQNSLESYIQWLAENLFVESFLTYYESCSLEAIKNAIQKLKALEFIVSTEIKQGKQMVVNYHIEPKNVETLKEFQERIMFFKPKSVEKFKWQGDDALSNVFKPKL